MTHTSVALVTGILLFALGEGVPADTGHPPPFRRTDHPLSLTLPSPPPDGTHWIHDEAQLGLPNAPFVFSGDGLYTAASFESAREFHIDRQAEIHTGGGTVLHLSGPVSNLDSSTQGLAKYGAGTLTLSGRNSYQGNTALHEGTLRVQGDSALGASYRTLDMYPGSTLSYAPDAVVYNAVQLHSGAAPEPAVRWRVDAGRATQAGAVVGSIPIIKLGRGTLRLAGFVTNPSLALLRQGGLAVDGFFAGPIQVSRGARLEGGGAVESATVLGGGTLAPGALTEPGMLVIRHLDLRPGATLEIDALADGRADSVQVLETARLDGLVRALAQPGDWQAHTRYAIVQAEQGFEGTRFDGATASLPFLEPQLSYDERHVYLSLARNDTPLEEAGDTPTEDEVADAIEEEGGAKPTAPEPGQEQEPGSGDDSDGGNGGNGGKPPGGGPAPGGTGTSGLHDKIAGMDKENARRALGLLSGSWAASIASRLLEDSRYIREAALMHAGSAPPHARPPQRAGTTHYWQHAFHSDADRGAWEGTPGDARRLDGLVLGGTHAISDALGVSAYLGAQQSRMWRAEQGSHARMDSRHAGLGLSGNWRGLQWALGAAHTWHAISSRRMLALPALSDALTGRYHGKTLQLFAEITAPLHWLGQRFRLQHQTPEPTRSAEPAAGIAPFARFAWVRHHTGGYGERGGAAALKAEPAGHTVLFSTLGLKAVHTLETPLGVARLTGAAAWRHAGGDVRVYSRQSFRDGARQVRFTSEGQPLARQAWSLRLGMEASLAGNGSLGFAYAGLFTPSGQRDHGARVDMAWTF